MSKVNLDALIPRADFISSGTPIGKQPNLDSLKLSDLLPDPTVNYSSIYHLLRKPDFQRETNAWDKKRIKELNRVLHRRAFYTCNNFMEKRANGVYFCDRRRTQVKRIDSVHK